MPTFHVYKLWYEQWEINARNEEEAKLLSIEKDGTFGGHFMANLSEWIVYKYNNDPYREKIINKYPDDYPKKILQAIENCQKRDILGIDCHPINLIKRYIDKKYFSE